MKERADVSRLKSRNSAVYGDDPGCRVPEVPNDLVQASCLEHTSLLSIKSRSVSSD